MRGDLRASHTRLTPLVFSLCVVTPTIVEPTDDMVLSQNLGPNETLASTPGSAALAAQRGVEAGISVGLCSESRSSVWNAGLSCFPSCRRTTVGTTRSHHLTQWTSGSVNPLSDVERPASHGFGNLAQAHTCSLFSCHGRPETPLDHDIQRQNT